MQGGELINLMQTIGNYRDLSDMLREAEHGIRRETLQSILRGLSNTKLKLTYINTTRKLRNFGPPANSPETRFEYEGKAITVADYFNTVYGKLSFVVTPCNYFHRFY